MAKKIATGRKILKRVVEKSREAPFQSAARVLIGSRRDCFILRINTGVFQPIDGDQNRKIRSAPTGTHDLLVCQLRRVMLPVTINPGGFTPHQTEQPFYYGQFISFETKSLTGPARKQQLAFQDSLIARGGISVFVRTEQEILDVLGPEPDWLDDLPEELLLPNEK